MKSTRIISIFILLIMMLSIFCLDGIALAQDEETTPADNITLSTQFPKIDAIATGTFQFSVDINYRGKTDRVFDLNAITPQGWDVYITPQYETNKRISSMTMKSSYSGMTQTVQLTTSAVTWPLPNPGEYKITLKVTSDDVSGKIDLIAKVTAKYALTAEPSGGLYNTKAKAGQDNTFSIKVSNIGTAAIDNITFSSDKPEGWEITFKPEKIDQLNTLDQNTVDVNIKPPPKTVAGDYMITMWVSGKQANADKMAVRVGVETPTIWGWVGVIIIIIVVVGLIVIFMRFGRR